MDWFEIKLTITLNLALFIQVGIFIKIGFIKVEIVLFEVRWEYQMNLLEPKNSRPRSITRIGRTSSDGILNLQIPDMKCESKGGSVGEEGV